MTFSCALFDQFTTSGVLCSDHDTERALYNLVRTALLGSVRCARKGFQKIGQPGVLLLWNTSYSQIPPGRSVPLRLSSPPHYWFFACGTPSTYGAFAFSCFAVHYGGSGIAATTLIWWSAYKVHCDATIEGRPSTLGL